MARKPKPDIAALEERIGHRFGDRSLIERALTHVSAVATKGARVDSYQRLEFLGDRVLGLAISDMLYAAFPKAAEGELSQRLAELVRKETCADVASEWGVGEHLRLGGGEAQTGGAKKVAILGDVCESVIGAVYLDAGFHAARDLVQRTWSERMMKPRRPLRDPKTALQEWAQARGLDTPIYREAGRSGPAHAPKFVIEVEVAGFAPTQAEGASKRLAEQAAARAFMAREGVDNRERAGS
ncbi:MAG: ribonuclease III [Beijerinckiaceae bacterium]|jgi:ribonuclease-3